MSPLQRLAASAAILAITATTVVACSVPNDVVPSRGVKTPGPVEVPCWENTDPNAKCIPSHGPVQ